MASRKHPPETTDPQAVDTDGWEESVKTQTEAAFDSLKRNSLLNFCVRVALYGTGVFALGFAVYYASKRGDDIVGVLINTDKEFNGTRLLDLVVPVLLLAALAGAALVTGLLMQSRAGADFEAGLDGISRLRREADTKVSRSRTTTHVLEEFLANAHTAFRLQLWLTRSLFIVCLGLFVAAVIDAISNGVDLLTLGLAAGSLVGLLSAIVRGAPDDVGDHLADSTQMQLVVASTTRELNVIEEFLYKTLEIHQSDPETVAPIVESGVAKMQSLTTDALELIERYAETSDQKAESAGGNGT